MKNFSGVEQDRLNLLLACAIMEHDEKKARDLILLGADVNRKSAIKETPLGLAIEYKLISIVKVLIEYGADVDAYIGDWPPIMFACENDNAEMVKVLIDAGANINARDKLGWTPLLKAKSFEVTKLLVEAGADINATNFRGKTALMLAANAGHAKSAELFLRSGADVSIRDNYGKRAKDCACSRKMRMLIKSAKA